MVFDVRKQQESANQQMPGKMKAKIRGGIG